MARGQGTTGKGGASAPATGTNAPTGAAPPAGAAPAGAGATPANAGATGGNMVNPSTQEAQEAAQGNQDEGLVAQGDAVPATGTSVADNTQKRRDIANGLRDEGYKVLKSGQDGDGHVLVIQKEGERSQTVRYGADGQQVQDES